VARQRRTHEQNAGNRADAFTLEQQGGAQLQRQEDGSGDPEHQVVAGMGCRQDAEQRRS
jgi:hypothetical protein